MAQPILELKGAAFRWGDGVVFPGTTWTWRPGQQWAVLGPNGSGKSVFALAVCGRIPLIEGEYHCDCSGSGAAVASRVFPEQSFALISARAQTELARAESSFYQERWHSGLAQSRRTVGKFLTQASVEEINPFEVAPHRGDAAEFTENRRRILRWLGLKPLLRRKLLSLSNGEQRKALLARALLRSPRLLVLDEPFEGLDAASRERLRKGIERLMRTGLPVLWIGSRPEEIPDGATHLLLLRNHRVCVAGPKPSVLRHALVRRLTREGKPRWTGSDRLEAAGRKSERGNSSQPTALLELNHVNVRAGATWILKDVTWTMRKGEHWAVRGPNGSGKTTLLSLLQGDHPLVYALNIRLFGLRPDSSAMFWRLRQHMGWVSPEMHQHYPEDWACVDVVCSGWSNTLGLHEPVSASRKRTAAGLLEILGLGDRREAPFGALPFGEQRLVLLARALVKRPRLLILDEACQGLDLAHRRRLLKATDDGVGRTGAGLIFVTHRAGELPACITHRLELARGRVARCGPLRAYLENRPVRRPSPRNR